MNRREALMKMAVVPVAPYLPLPLPAGGNFSQQRAKGEDIFSAAVVDSKPDGNVFYVTGTTTITSIGTGWEND